MRWLALVLGIVATVVTTVSGLHNIRGRRIEMCAKCALREECAQEEDRPAHCPWRLGRRLTGLKKLHGRRPKREPQAEEPRKEIGGTYES